MKAQERNGWAFPFLCEKFSTLRMGNIKVGVYIGPQECQLFRDLQFDLTLSDDEKAAWSAFRHDETGFLESVKVSTSGSLWRIFPFLWEARLQLVTQDAFPSWTLGILFWLTVVPQVMEHDVHFQQDISAMENAYRHKWNAAILADYCWAMKRVSLEIQYKQQVTRPLVQFM